MFHLTGKIHKSAINNRRTLKKIQIIDERTAKRPHHEYEKEKIHDNEKNKVKNKKGINRNKVIRRITKFQKMTKTEEDDQNVPTRKEQQGDKKQKGRKNQRKKLGAAKGITKTHSHSISGDFRIRFHQSTS